MNAATGSHWQRRAVCVLETPDAPEVWTPDRKPARTVRLHLEQMCQRCPVRRDCALNAVTNGAETGMYAGVWVPQQSERKSWAAAMQRLERIAGIGTDAIAVDVLGVPA
jgi:WhiB family redox-sensing transcriptional regulator